MKKTIYILFLLTAISCGKQIVDTAGETSGSPILFNVSDQVGVKSSVESVDDLIYNSSTNPDAHVFIYATKENADFKKQTPGSDPPTYDYDYTDKELFYDDAVGLWDISGTKAQKASWECNDSTHNGYTYNFSAYAVRGSGHITNITRTNFNTFGRSFSVKLPESYSAGCGTDFLLSNICSVVSTWNGSAARGSVVNLHMEHALASVRVNLKANADIYKIGIQGIQIKNFYREGSMQCTSQASYGSGKRNVWTMLNPSLNTTDYIVGDVTAGSGNTRNTIAKCTGMIINKTDARERNIMDFIALPQDLSEAVLTIAYLVQEIDGASEHQVVSTWNLRDFSPWEYGYRNVYTITIDTSNSLYATIDDWNTGNSVTGVILP